MFSVFVGTNKRNLSTSAVEAETNYIEGEVLEKIRGSPRITPVFGMAYRDRLPQKLRFFFLQPPRRGNSQAPEKKRLNILSIRSC